jgi:hypothetical protein
MRDNPNTDLILIGPKVKIQLTSSTQKPKKKKKKKQSKQKTKNNKISPKAASKEYNIVDISGRHNLAHEIYVSASEKHTPVRETLKLPKQTPKETIKKTPHTILLSAMFFPWTSRFFFFFFLSVLNKCSFKQYHK